MPVRRPSTARAHGALPDRPRKPRAACGGPKAARGANSVAPQSRDRGASRSERDRAHRSRSAPCRRRALAREPSPCAASGRPALRQPRRSRSTRAPTTSREKSLRRSRHSRAAAPTANGTRRRPAARAALSAPGIRCRSAPFRVALGATDRRPTNRLHSPPAPGRRPRRCQVAPSRWRAEYRAAAFRSGCNALPRRCFPSHRTDRSA